MASEQEKIAVEEKIPLQSDTDVPATETPAEAPATEQKPEEPKAKKSWFGFGSKGKKPAATEEQPAAEEEKTEGDAEEKPKKKGKFSWFFDKKQKSEQEQKDENISIGIDMVNRDEGNNQDIIHTPFGNIFGEADSAHSLDFGWRWTNAVFNFTRNFVYKAVAFPIQIIAAIFFGIFFALFAVAWSYIIVPAGKLLMIIGTLFAKPWEFLIHAIFDPITSSCGLVFSRVSMRSYGIHQQPTDPCIA